MRRRARSSWAVFAAGFALALGALGWMTRQRLALERGEARARAESARQADLRLALWRMDSWMAPLVTREASRAPGEYRDTSPQAVLTSFSSAFVRVHFELEPDGRWTSPSPLAARAALERLRERTGWHDLAARVGGSESLLRAQTDVEWLTQCQVDFDGSAALPAQELARNTVELGQRARQSWNQAQNREYGVASPPGITTGVGLENVGPLVPVWLAASGVPPDLLFVRRVVGLGVERIQGFLADWPAIAAALTQEAADLVPGAELAPLPDGSFDELSGLWLASLPAALVPPPVAEHPGLPPSARADLLLPWIATLLALAAVGLTLRATQTDGERKSRFASSVTHELRTPLTTFRLYSEMLARGMVPEEKRALYLETLERESARLADLVESVLAYSRLEQGRTATRRRRLTAGELVGAIEPELRRRVREAQGEWVLDAAGCEAVALDTDPEAVGRILLNLVDNACKYAIEGDAREVRLELRSTRDELRLAVRDRGRGIPARARRRLFQAFERGSGAGTGRCARHASPGPPGLGLGLALARALAGDLGGKLELEPCPEGGACFRLDLPLAPG